MAKSKPIPEAKSTILSWEEVDKNLKLIGNLQNKIKVQEAEMNEKILAIQNSYVNGINKLTGEKQSLEINVELFCKEHKEDLGEKKSKELSFGTISFRLTPPALKTLKGFTWESVKKIIEKSRKYADKFLRTKVDLDKNAITNDNLPPKDLAALGLHMAQSENFYLEIKEATGTNA